MDKKMLGHGRKQKTLFPPKMYLNKVLPLHNTCIKSAILFTLECPCEEITLKERKMTMIAFHILARVKSDNSSTLVKAGN
jgi:hypothetical protein